MSAEHMEENLRNAYLKVRNYKGFGSEASGYEQILPINLIIGRNNTGKSTLLDLIDFATSPSDLSNLGHKRRTPQVLMQSRITGEQTGMIFPKGQRSSIVDHVWSGDDWTFGQQWIDTRIVWELGTNGSGKVIDFDLPGAFGRADTFGGLEEDKKRFEPFAQQLASVSENPFTGYTFKRILSDRDITPEKEGHEPIIRANGSGLTSTVERYLHDYGLPGNLVEVAILQELNKIFEPDGTFTDIGIQRHEDKSWEVYVEEEEKGRVLLANTGSGIKTILLVLAFLYLVPDMEKKDLSQYIFGFEELENNLHPALQRRLLLYLRNIAMEKGCRIFLTTHSNVSIDLFSEDRDAQILHVTHNKMQASVRTITTYVDNKGILDDLDVRASDLLQANGIIWVEGPSDRIYFNRWVSVFSNDTYREGIHYQCVFYGGRLLSHLSAADPDVNEDEALKILRVNRNAIMLMDSDRRKPRQHLNS